MRATKIQATYQWYGENGIDPGVVTVLTDVIPRDGDHVRLDVESGGRKFKIEATVEWICWEIGKTETEVSISLYDVKMPFSHRPKEEVGE